MGKIEARKTRRAKRMTKTRTGGKQNRHFRKQPTIGNPIIEKQWDKTKTLRENYSQLGLATDPSKTVSSVTKKEKSESMHISQVEALAQTPLIKELEEYAASEVKKQIHQAPGEVAFVKPLIAKHGSDYKAMARSKLNTHQHTPKVLQRMCERYLQTMDES